MGKIKLRPSEIRFSQDSINNTFSPNAHLVGGMKIGEVLDRIYDDPTTDLFNALKKNMQVSQHPRYAGLWFAVNNRSLWVLKQLEILGRLTEPISLLKVDKLYLKDRFTTKTLGETILVRGYMVGGEKAIPTTFWTCKNRQAIVFQSSSACFTGFNIDGDDYDSDHTDGDDYDSYHIDGDDYDSYHTDGDDYDSDHTDGDDYDSDQYYN